MSLCFNTACLYLGALPKSFIKRCYTDTKGEGKSRPIRRMPAVLKFPCTGRRFLSPKPEFLRSYQNFSGRFPVPTASFYFHPAGIFPVIFPFPTLYTGKTPAPLDERDSGLSNGEIVLWGVSKNIPLGNYLTYVSRYDIFRQRA